MSWYPGKLLEKMRQKTRTQYWELPPPDQTPEKAGMYFELVFLDLLEDLNRAYDSLSDVFHEMAEVERQTRTLQYLDRVAGGKYADIVNTLQTKGDEVANRVWDLMRAVEQLRDAVRRPYFIEKRS